MIAQLAVVPLQHNVMFCSVGLPFSGASAVEALSSAAGAEASIKMQLERLLKGDWCMESKSFLLI